MQSNNTDATVVFTAFFFFPAASGLNLKEQTHKKVKCVFGHNFLVVAEKPLFV